MFNRFIEMIRGLMVSYLFAFIILGVMVEVALLIIFTVVIVKLVTGG